MGDVGSPVGDEVVGCSGAGTGGAKGGSLRGLDGATRGG